MSLTSPKTETSVWADHSLGGNSPSSIKDWRTTRHRGDSSREPRLRNSGEEFRGTIPNRLGEFREITESHERIDVPMKVKCRRWRCRAVHCFKMPSLAKSPPTCDAFRRSASAMLVTPMVRSKPIVAFRKAAITSGPERLRIRLASSPIVTSRT